MLPRPPQRPKTASAVSEEPTEDPVALWPVALGLIAASLTLCLATKPGWIIADNRIVQFWRPEKVVESARVTWSDVNMGAVPGVQGLGIYAYSAVLRLLGAPPWLVERLFHATLLALGSVGAAVVTREFLPRQRVAHIAAGVWWLASPFTSAFLFPSMLFAHAALAPWLFLAVLRGLTTTSRWRWAAVFALLLAFVGLTNPPALVWASVPLVPLVVFLVVTRATTVREAAAWVARAGALVLCALAFELQRARMITGYFSQNLASSETADAVSRSSSWSETLRGLGNWLSYWNPGGPLVEPYLTSFFRDSFMIAATFLPVIAIVAVIALNRSRVVTLFGSILLLAALMMVGGYPLDDQSPFGRALFWFYERVPSSFALRNTYKAGAGLMLATTVLLGLATAMFVRWMRDGKLRRRFVGGGAGALAVVVVVASSSPLWTGAMYEDRLATKSIPSYWTSALDWLDEQSTPGRVLITPGGVEGYRWGAVPNGDLFGLFLQRPFILPGSLAQSSPDAGNLIAVVNDELSHGTYRQGSIAPIARRMGIGYVVLRNDVHWEGTSVARPSQLEALRTDPDLVLDATFGRAGENVIDPNDVSYDAGLERLLPPVQIYRVRGVNESVHATTGPSLLLSGDARAWPSLAISGVLDRSGPIRYTGRLSTSDLSGELKAGAGVLVTDTNRDTGTGNGLFGRDGSETTATFRDATAISYAGPAGLVGTSAANRPAAAFDGDPTTMFSAGALAPLTGSERLHVALRDPEPVSEISIDARPNGVARRVTRAAVEFPNGVVVPVDLSTGQATVSFETQTVDQFDVHVLALAGEGPGVGILRDSAWVIREVTVDGLDLRESVQMPDDVVRLADDDAEAAAALASAPLSYHMSRRALGDEETTLRRQLRVPSDRSFSGRGTLQLRPSATSDELALLLDKQITAQSAARFGNVLESSGMFAVDGDDATAWQSTPGFPADLDVTIATQPVSSVAITIDDGLFAVGVRQLALTVGTTTLLVPHERRTDCPADGTCLQTTSVAVPPTQTANVRLSILSTDPAAPPDTPVRVTEVTVNGTPNDAIPDTATTACRSGLATIDGRSVPLRVTGFTTLLLAGQPVEAALCDPVALPAGWHELATGAGAPLDDFTLTATTPGVATAAAPAPVTVERSSTTSAIVTVPGGSRLVFGAAMSSGWEASADGAGLGPPVELDTQVGWIVPDGGPTTVAISFSAQTLSRLLLVLAGLTVVACVLLIVLDPRRPEPRPVERPSGRHFAPPSSAIWLPRVAAGAFAFLAAGLAGLVLAGAALFVLSRGVPPRTVGAVGVVYVVVAALFTLPPLAPDADLVTPAWPTERHSAHDAALAGAILLAALLAGSRRPRRSATEA